MRKSKRIIALIAALTFVASAFAACANDNGTTSSGTTSSSGTSSTDSSTTSTETPSGETANLKWIQIGGQPNDLQMVTDAMNEYSKEKINATIEFTYLDWGVWSDRVKAIMNSGEPFDIMFNNGDVYSSGVQLGVFADITDMLDTVPDLKAFIPEMVWDGTRIKDRIYAVPTYKDSSQTQYWVWDKEVVESLNIDYKNIHTPKELDPVLYQIQDAIKAGTITGAPYAFMNTKDGINGQFMFYDASVSAVGVRYDDKDAKVVRILEQPEMIEQFTYMHKWYKDGIINPDAPTLTEGPKWIVVGSAQGFPGAETTWTAGRGKEVVIEPWGGPIYSTGTIMGSVNSISSASKNKEAALKYLELANLDSNFRNMLVYGIEGTHYTDNGDGTITRDDVKKDDYSPAGYAQATFFTMSPVAPNAADQWTKVQDWNESATASVLIGFAFDRTNVENEIANCSAVSERYNAELYTGASDPAVKIPELYAELEKAGLAKIEAELQAQIDAYLGK